MLGLDEQIAHLADGGPALALLVAVLLGLRHATDPDHLTAVSTLVVGDDRRGARRAGLLGLSWGLGHAVTLVLLGVPLIVAGTLLSDTLQRGAELAIGAVIVLLAVRLLLRWRRGHFHSHEHVHGDRVHAHPLFHEHSHAGEHAHVDTGGETIGHADGAAAPSAGHRHTASDDGGRRPLAAFGIGLVHGAGGSAGAGLLLVSAMPSRVTAVVALGLLAAGTAIAMAVASLALGGALGHPRAQGRVESLVPVLGAAGLVFGIWYGLGALETVPYLL